MTMSRPDLVQLSKAQIEELLTRSQLPAEERKALVDELTRRVAQELLDGPGQEPAPPRNGGPGTHRQPPRQPPGPPPPSPPPPRGARATTAPPGTHAPTGDSGGRRRGFSRSRAALIALAVVIGVAVAVLAVAAGSGTITGGGASGNSGADVVGPSGTTQVAWTLNGVDYVADLETDGTSGVVDVTYLDPLTGTVSVVRQDLTFERASGGYTYTGSNPRDAVTGTPVDDYLPDTFWLEPGAVDWDFVQVCDAANQCVALSAQ